MLKFIAVKQHQPDKRPASQRKLDFAEIYRRFSLDRAQEQASRCSQCGVPFCSVNCPLQNYIPDWLKLTAEDRLEEAYNLSSSTNSFPEICGRICPQDRLCEGNCVIEADFHSVTIGAVESFITDTAFEKGWVQPIVPIIEKKQSIGIIGSGPCGMAAAGILRQKGYQVHIYDRYDRAGGLLTYGIPTFKLEKETIARRQEWLEKSGIIFHFGISISDQDSKHTLSFANLRKLHDAIFLATGVYKKKDVTVPGTNLNGVIQALDYLVASNKAIQSGNSSPDPMFNAKDKDIIVVGGGDTAMDCLRTAIRQGAKSVKCLYRRDKYNMPGSMREVKNAEEEGVEFIWQAAPEAFIGTEKVNSILAIRTELGLPDASGRQTVKLLSDSLFTLPADMVIKAFGFDPEPLPQLWNEPSLKLSPSGTIKIDKKTFSTSLDGVYAGGDIVRGASLVVWAIRDGREAAHQIDRYLSQKEKHSVEEQNTKEKVV